MRRRFRSVAIAAALAVAIPLPSACGPGPATGAGDAASRRVPGGFSAVARAAFDSARAAFEAGDAARARDLFAATLAEDSTLAAAWIGLHLAGRALDPGVQEDSALRRARALIEPPRPRGRGAKPAT